MKLRIEKALYGGPGLARFPAQELAPGDPKKSQQGKAVFVPLALPGELIEGHVVENRRDFSTAEVESVLEPSPHRVAPGCEYFPACGGCQYQHADSLYQSRMKLDILKDMLARAHLQSHLDSIPPITCISGPEWGYRNRIRLHIMEHNGVLHVCYRERRSHSNLPVTHCPIAAPLIQRAVTAVRQCGQATGLAGLADEIEFFANGDDSALLVTLWKRALRAPSRARAGVSQSGARRSWDRGLREFSEQLRDRIPELAGAGIVVDQKGDQKGDRNNTGRLLHQWGRQSIVSTIAGRSYQVSLGSFFQINRFLIPELLRSVLENQANENRSGRLAWDLYAGVGLFTLALGSNGGFDRVVAVEASAPAAADLKQNLAGTPHRAVQSTALKFLRDHSRTVTRSKSGGMSSGAPSTVPDLILLDPPRAGLGGEICEHLLRIAPPVIVYVSCDPATLARDLQTLLQSRYHLDSMRMVDMFPQTFHLETVTVLKRTSNERTEDA